uniref:Ubiquitin-like domain-containing protein n=1 Tax=Pyramimonas obovata TaxID=1411642 RepID=A0A7S0WW41_9CHLO|mmetsp:Transcript_7115/g.14395  ORF Transcript_7115/g.14395 Transcript_7115/m.14395 type:complete len:105 (+) Transcript_7115:168-482(+)
MGLGLQVERECNELSTTMQEEQEALGGTVQIILKLPDGREIPHDFHIGQSVGYVKAVIQRDYGHVVANTTLTLGGKTLIDPMCLTDYPEIKPSEGAVFVVTVKS